MIMTEQEALHRVSARVYENTRKLKQSDVQRRNTVVDLYGIPIQAYGDQNSPARFYVSVSPDLIEYHRFQFKLDVQPFRSTSGSGTGTATVNVQDTSLSVSGGSITPNPHKHSTTPHTHTLNAGIMSVPAASGGYRLSVDGYDITPYLLAQHPWVTGEGLYPSTDTQRNYDMLVVASDLEIEGKQTERENLLKSGFKSVELSANGPFMATLWLYLKYENLSR